MDEMKVAARIKHLARVKGISIGELENKMGKTWHGIFAQCRVKRCGLNLADILKAAEILEVEPKVLLEEERGWQKEFPTRSKSISYICPECGERCLCGNEGECNYRFCPNCGGKILK